MRPVPPKGTDARLTPEKPPLRPGTAPKLTADSRPGHPRNAAPTQFNDWALF